MAETIKKSRIVSESDENLEECLLEEFNLRLKNCMSRDDLQAADDDDVDHCIIPTEQQQEHIYENLEVLPNKENGVTPNNHNSSQEFLDNEREHYNKTITTNGHLENRDNLEILDIESSHIVECTTKTDTCCPDQSPKTIDLQLDLNSDTPDLNLPTTCLTDMSNPLEIETEIKSAKNRMFLSSDDAASCLLFTQTVTSPMLTPSEENIDFLKGFRRESTQNDNTSSSNSPKSNNSDAVVEITNTNLVLDKEPIPEHKVVDEIKQNVEEEKHIYENTQFLKEHIYENVNPLKSDVELLNGNSKSELDVVTKETTSEFIKNEISFLTNDQNVTVEKHFESKTTNGQSKQVEGTEDVCDIPADMVKNLKSHFMKPENTEPLKSPRLETNDELDELKSLNIMKQISKFEKHEEIISTNACSTNFSVSTVTESHFVESHSETQFTDDKSIKKKKSKKSKNQHEKENISVSDAINNSNTEEESSFYNVNVKSLCRSFGDLRKIDKEQLNEINNRRTRTKSMTDFQIPDKRIENVFMGVSVRTLREKFSNNVSATATNKVMLFCKKVKCPNRLYEKFEILKSSFSKFDALQKKNGYGNQSELENGGDSCKACGRPVFQMERIVANRCMYHRSCFRCRECGKQLLADNYDSHEGVLYCKPHFRALFAPQKVEDDDDDAGDGSTRPRKYEVIIRENQPAELPPDVIRASDKPDLGLEELHRLNVKERFQVFENVKPTQDNQLERNPVKMEKSPSILSKLARFHAKGMDVGVTDDSLNGVPVELSESEEEDDEDGIEGEDADLIRAKRVQKEKPFHFVQMSDVKSKWEQGNQQNNRDERREECKQEIQNIRSRLFHGKQGKMKEAYQQAIAESETKGNAQKEVPLEAADTRSIKDKFEKGELVSNELKHKQTEDMSIFESGIGKQSRSIFQELDATGGLPPKITSSSPPKLGNSVRSAREAYLAKQASEDTVKSTDHVDEITVRTADIQDRYQFFETYKEPKQSRKEFRMTPPREGQMKSKTPEREIPMNPDVVRSDDYVEDSVVAKATHTATKMLNKFRQMEENLQRGQESQGLKPMKRFTPPREPLKRESSSEGESESEEEESEDERMHRERDLIEAQKAARAKQMKAKFERWDSQPEYRRESSVNLTEEFGDDSQIETTKTLCAKFESIRDTSNGSRQEGRVKVNRFVDINGSHLGGVRGQEKSCGTCSSKVYPLEKISVHGYTFHKKCFRCKVCNTILRMDSYSYNQGLLYCTTHFKRLFMSKGNYDSAFGLEQHKDKWNNVTVA